jgi:predicted nucleic acid-binding protein
MSFLKNGYSLYTVDIALAESLNALWKHTKIHKDLKTQEAKSAVQDLTKIWDELNVLTTRALTPETISTSLTQNITIYDSLYIAATRKLNATLYTADRKLHDISKKIISSKLLESSTKSKP